MSYGSNYQGPPPKQDNQGVNFAGYSIGIGVLALVLVPLLIMLLCCGFFLVAGVANVETDPSPSRSVSR